MKPSANAIEQVIGKPEKEWSGLFSLYRNPDGSYRVELGTITAPREVALRWKLDEQERELMSALVMICSEFAKTPIVYVPEPKYQIPFGGSNANEIYYAAKAIQEQAGVFRHLAGKMQTAIGDDLQSLTDATKSKTERLRAKKKIETKISHALEALIKKGSRKAHGSSKIVKASFGQAPLAWAVINATKKLVLKHHELPTKQMVKTFLTGKDSTLKYVSSAQWADEFKDAGLASLPKAVPKKSGSRK